ncbi:hypothetical protein CIPAW_02G143700 [Carya illinoinensis]|uniref:Protein kinase domain-containing protein n=1 Tax=Carya illinoinensis TaxID=32201 RepID=A0A8T1REC4_CARIL|nr:hypothetical protein CIPAW_02G143700 [Carya illinoinensis]
MAGFEPFIFAFLGVLYLILLLLIHAQGQSGFISIDCGLPADSPYKEELTGIDYISDANFIDTGISSRIASEFKGDYRRREWNLRSFPEGVRNCYTIKNITRGTRYLIRGTFLHGNYDGESNLPEFDLYLGTDKWDTVKVEDASYRIIKELIHVPSRNYIHVCLVRTSDLGTPFISSIQFRPLNKNSYETEYGSLALYLRADAGSNTYYSYGQKYPYDVHDRRWTPYNSSEWTDYIWSPSTDLKDLSTELTIDNSKSDYKPASVAMNTAITPVNESAPMGFIDWEPDNKNTQIYIYMHFAEVVKLEPNQFRSFNITLNGKHWYGPVVPNYLSTTTVYSTGPETGGTYNFSMVKAEGSTLPPILNAVEIYYVKDFLQSETDQEDVDAIIKIKSTYGIKRDWQGDPCAPKQYSWEGLDCSYDADNYAHRITSLSIEIPADISNLLMLQFLDLSNNSLTGSVPDFLSKLINLKVLNLERNKLTGSIPRELIERRDNHSLSLSFVVNSMPYFASVGENPDLCGSRSCKKNKNNIVIPIASVAGGLLVFTFIAVAIFWGIRRGSRTKQDAESNKQNATLESLQRQFTYSEILRITNNFERILGKGGFGTVYHGYIDDTQVAVKMLSHSSVQGYQQFQTEVRLLMRVHHRNLTTLVGYCYEGTNLGLVYEYMANGDLDAHLSDGNTQTLTWKDRLRIATDAAQGLEYLHCGCKPPIVHRDVKTTNILLNENLQAKLADFGYSKIFPTDGGTYVSTVVAGTPGYLDPEYYITNWLTEKSDVYSFGVVLLKIITNRPAIERSQERTHVSEFVRSMLAKGDIKNMVDPRLHGNFNINSVWKAVEIAIGCVSPTAAKRPTMSQVVVDLKECMATELARVNDQGGSRESIKMINLDLGTELIPLAR